MKFAIQGHCAVFSEGLLNTDSRQGCLQSGPNQSVKEESFQEASQLVISTDIQDVVLQTKRKRCWEPRFQIKPPPKMHTRRNIFQKKKCEIDN